jgi:hypothetical protein
MNDAALVLSDHLAAALKPACQRCHWMFRDGDMSCRRNPPQANVLLMPAQPPRVGIAPAVMTAFPIVQRDMFCGEFRLATGKMD